MPADVAAGSVGARGQLVRVDRHWSLPAAVRLPPRSLSVRLPLARLARAAAAASLSASLPFSLLLAEGLYPQGELLRSPNGLYDRALLHLRHKDFSVLYEEMSGAGGGAWRTPASAAIDE